MLDGGRCDSELPEEHLDGGSRLLVSEELLVTLRAIEKEISQFIRDGPEEGAPSIVAGHDGEQAGS